MSNEREEADVWRDLVERAHHLAICVFKGTSKADAERNRHNAAVLSNAIDHAKQNERNRAALDAPPSCEMRKALDTIEWAIPLLPECKRAIQACRDARAALDAAPSCEMRKALVNARHYVKGTLDDSGHRKRIMDEIDAALAPQPTGVSRNG